MKRLDLVVGPNGAGKSTFVAETLAPLLPLSPFVNADVIASRMWPDAPEAHAYEAARVAAETRAKLVASGRSFIAETVFSHPSKLEEIRNARREGYAVIVHVLLVPEQLAVARVEYRVRAGGHGVPEQKIRERYCRLWSLVAVAVRRVELASVYDNSHASGPRRVAYFAGGVVVGAPSWPSWTPAPLLSLTT